MNRMMAATISAGATTRAPYGDGVAAEPGVDHPAADRDEDQEERAEQLGEQPPPLVAVVPEVELAGDRVRLPHRPQSDLATTGRLLLGDPRWPSLPPRPAHHLAFLPGFHRLLPPCW